MNKKILGMAALLLATVTISVGCGDAAAEAFNETLGYSNGTIAATDKNGKEILKGLEYDEKLFYRNDLTLDEAADPTVIYVDGTLYLYGTSSNFGTYGVGVWASTDGIHWDSYGVAFEPERESWSYTYIWAPEVIYDETSNLYYMTYSARNSNTFANGGDYYANTYIGLAYSESPFGPFVQYTGTNQDGRDIGIGDPIFDPKYITAVDGVECEEGFYQRYRFLDSSFFIDDDGELYMYFVRAQDIYDVLTEEDPNYEYLSNCSEIWGVKFKDFATPDYSSVTQLTKIGYNTVDGVEGDENDIDQERANKARINEAPIMYKKDGTYYLTYSVGSTTSTLYSVAQALGTEPLGDFTKLTKAEGGLVLGADSKWVQNAGSAHHCLTEIGDELFIFHHEGQDRYTIDMGGRAIAYNRIGFTQNSNGDTVMVGNGPTSYSLQALPSAISGYKNIAKEATVTASGVKSGSDKKYLTDGLFASHTYGVVKETEFNVNETITITLEWDDYRTVSAIMLYNSIDYDKIFYQIAQIKLSVRTASGAEGTAVINNATFPLNETTCYSSMQFMFAGNNMVFDFNDIQVKNIQITFKAPRKSGSVAISDIWVLAK